MKVIESGLINEDIKNRGQDLEKEKSEIKIALAETELNKDVSLMRSGILYLQTAKTPGVTLSGIKKAAADDIRTLRAKQGKRESNPH